MAEEFKNRTPDEMRQLADSALADGFSKLASALQQVGIVALVSKASDQELAVINHRQSPLADTEYLRIVEGWLIDKPTFTFICAMNMGIPRLRLQR